LSNPSDISDSIVDIKRTTAFGLAPELPERPQLGRKPAFVHAILRQSTPAHRSGFTSS